MKNNIVLFFLFSMFMSSLVLTSEPKDIRSVSMWDQKMITSFPHDGNKESIIYTQGLGGCVAVALIVKKSSGVQHALMSHYFPISKQDQINVFEKESRKLLSSTGDTVQSKHLIILVPGYWKEDNDGKFTMIPQESYLHFIESFKNALRIDPVVSAYSEETEYSYEKENDLLPYDRALKSDFSVILTGTRAVWRSFGDGRQPHTL